MKSKLNNFLRYLLIEKGFSQGTIEAYQLDIEKGLIPFLRQRGKCEVGEVTKDDIRAYLDYQATVRGNSNATRARKLAAIKSFFNYLVEDEGLEVNPAGSIRSPKIPEKEPEYLTDEESMQLLTTIAREAKPQVRQRDMAIVILLLHTGLRGSELTKLDLVNVDLGRAQIKVTRKGNKEQYLHLNGETVHMLAAYLAKRPEAGNGRFFVGTKGSNLDRIYLYNLVRRYLKLAGINKGKHGPHLLRHTFCTRLHQKGVDPFTIKELAGHKSLNTTMRYIRIENKEQAEAIDRLEFGFMIRR
ncbi:MAG: tyrosine-type recombinase/integrase [Chloroflexi bacterium]|nr:tyrosine-type recombinase/integrase [Chloroflexota bacterium]